MAKLYFGVMIFAVLNIVCSYSLSDYEYKKKRNENKDCKNAIIDLNKFYNSSGYEVTYGKDKYFLNICGEAPQCGKDVAVCRIINKLKVIPLGYYHNLALQPRYKIGIKYAIQTKKSNYSIIEFRCNRHLTDHRVQFVPKQQMGREHTFLFESPMACVNLPTNCLVNNVDDNTQFDLRPLFKTNGNWKVTDVPTGSSIYLNMCGALNPLQNLADNECSYPGTIVCAVTNNQTQNLGIFSSEWNTKEGLSITFTDGSPCINDGYKNTTIEFRCNFEQLEPKFVSANDCQYKIEWYTPLACPYYISVNRDCKIDDNMLGSKNMTINPSEPEQNIKLDSSTTLKFNICGPVSRTCDGHKNVSFCLIREEKEMAIGWANNTITAKNGLMKMQVFGNTCSRKKRSVVNIEFRCNYALNSKPKINMSNDMCIVNMVIFTNVACPESEPKIESCRTKEVNGSYFDLSPLTLLGSNYEVQDPDDSSIVYILNVCKPVIYSQSSACDQYSSVCVKNITEPNFTKRFKTVGNSLVSQIDQRDGRPFITYTASICASGSEAEYSTHIEFRCVNSSDQETSPKLLSKTKCQYNFLWETRHACIQQHSVMKIPIEQNQSSTTGKNNKIDNEIKKEHNLDTQLDDILHVAINIVKNAKHAEENTEVNQFVEEKQIVYNTKSQSNEVNGIINIPDRPVDVKDTDKTTVESPILDKVNNANINGKNNRTVLVVPVDVLNSTGISIRNCTLTDSKANYNVSMHSLPRIINVTSDSGRRYAVHICKSPKKEKCTASVCPNEPVGTYADRAILSNVHIVPDTHSVDMEFQGHLKCNTGFFNSVIFMKCDQQTHQPSILKEDDCSVQLEWKNAAACRLLDLSHRSISLLPNASTHGSAMVPIVVSVVVFLCIFMAFAAYLVWRRRFRKINSSPVRCYDRVHYSKNEYLSQTSQL